MSENFYRAFEEKFRGSRTLIRTRLGVYKPFLSPLKHLHVHPQGLDLGCGRGEWLEVLQEEGITPLGVDLDEGMLEACRALNLPAIQGDAVAYLAGLPSESLVVISAFHMVEHIPFDWLQKVILEAHRVLVPGGLLILETPNPENISVGTRDFYLDPTHQRPIPPQLLAYLPEHQGFLRSKILRLQQSLDLEQNPDPGLLDVLEGVSPDYAVVAQKAGDDAQVSALDPAFSAEYGLSLQVLASRYDGSTKSRAHQLQHQVRRAETSATQALSLAEEAATKARQLTELQAIMEQQMAMTSEYLGQLDQRTLATENQMVALLNSRSWRVTAPLRWVGMQMNLLRAHGLRGRLGAALRRFGFAVNPDPSAPVASHATQEAPASRPDLPDARYPGMHADEALADPGLAELARPLSPGVSGSMAKPSDGEIDHEPILHLSVLQDASAPLAIVVLVGTADLSAIQRTVHSILRQTDPAWELVFHVSESRAYLLDEWLDADWRIRRAVHPQDVELAALSQSMSMATARFVGMVEAGDTLDDDLVKSFNRVASTEQTVDVIYCDEWWQGEEPGKPPVEVRKPDWSPEQQLSVDMLGRFCAIRKSLALTLEVWPTSHTSVALYGLNLQAAERARKVIHVAELLHVRMASVVAGRPGGYFAPECWSDLLQGVRNHLNRSGREIAQLQMDASLGSLLVRPAVPDGVPVTVVILTAMRTRDVPGRGPIVLAENFVRSIIEKTAYPNYRILLVDDGESSPALTELLKEHGHRVASYREEGPFSFARKSNFATRLADDGVVVLLNDDMEVLSPYWLQWMVAHAMQPAVGVVGAKLLFADNSIQHAGIVLGMNGSCGHALHQYPDGTEYLALSSIDRNCSAVTGAAMAYRKSVFESLGGFDEAFRVDYNDIDFCLRCLELNLRVVFASQAVLYHFHNSSFERPFDDASERVLFLSRWSHLMTTDRYFPVHLLSLSLAGQSTESLNSE